MTPPPPWGIPGSPQGETATPASGPRPFLWILPCAPRPVRVRCRLSHHLPVGSGGGGQAPEKSPLGEMAQDACPFHFFTFHRAGRVPAGPPSPLFQGAGQGAVFCRWAL
eukprot:gene12006-biopygen4902